MISKPGYPWQRNLIMNMGYKISGFWMRTHPSVICDHIQRMDAGTSKGWMRTHTSVGYNHQTKSCTKY